MTGRKLEKSLLEPPAALGGIVRKSLPRWLSRPEAQEKMRLPHSDAKRLKKRYCTVLKAGRSKHTLAISLSNSLRSLRTAGFYPCFFF